MASTATTTDFFKPFLSPFPNGNKAGSRQNNMVWLNRKNRSLRVNGLFGGGKKENSEDGQSKTSSTRPCLNIFCLLSQSIFRVNSTLS
uniref:Uncharacterized protein n=1 Tax=Brassica oleracea var. oleracea TaxID=109376 RepID=A0A0D3BM57_BRAOL